MLDKRTVDYITTFLFIIIAIIAFYSAQILQSTPAAVIGIVTIIMGIISQLVSNNRVIFDQKIEEFKTWKWVQYTLTFIVIIAPILQIYQPQILAWLPPGIAIFAAPAIALILQFASGKREQNTIVNMDTVSINEKGVA